MILFGVNFILAKTLKYLIKPFYIAYMTSYSVYNKSDNNFHRESLGSLSLSIQVSSPVQNSWQDSNNTRLRIRPFDTFKISPEYLHTVQILLSIVISKSTRTYWMLKPAPFICHLSGSFMKWQISRDYTDPPRLQRPKRFQQSDHKKHNHLVLSS